MSDGDVVEAIRNGEFILKTGAEQQTFATGAKRDAQTGKGRFDLVPLYPILRLAKIFEAGAVKYGADNWLNGMPLRRYWDSASRHLLAYSVGLQDEDHLGQALWNIWCLMTTEALIKNGALPEGLRDMPNPKLALLQGDVLKMTTPPKKV
jgi:hypothetical protein